MVEVWVVRETVCVVYPNNAGWVTVVTPMGSHQAWGAVDEFAEDIVQWVPMKGTEVKSEEAR